VAAVATLLIGIVYVVFVVTFDMIDTHHLVAQVDASLGANRRCQSSRQGVAGSYAPWTMTMMSIRPPSSYGGSKPTDTR
jgi:hypothetical protein